MKRKATAVLFVLLILIGAASVSASKWQALRSDGLHDRSNPAIDILQEPEEALAVLDPDAAGNKVNWVTSLQNGQIRPRAGLDDAARPEVLDQDVLMTNTLPLPYVKFPHKPHTEWMACANCHEQIFVSRAGANDINMARILEGEYCGVCHGAVAFPLTECNRCHDTDSSTVRTDGAVNVAEPPQ